jgi:hypothetical protein
MTQRPRAPQESIQRIRYRAELRTRAQNAEIIEIRDKTLLSLDECLRQLSEGPAAKAVNLATNREQYVMDVLSLTQRIGDVMKKISFILSIFKAGHPINKDSGRPSMDPRHTGLLISNLEMALKHLQSININPHQAREDLSLLAPDHHVITEMSELVTALDKNPDTDHTREIIRVMADLDAYLNGIINATDMGVTFSVITTRERVSELRDHADGIHKMAVEAELLEFEQPQRDKTEKNLFNLLRDLEYVLSTCTVKITDIYQKNAIWLLTKVDVRTLQNLTRVAQKRMDSMEEELASMTEQSTREPGLMTRLRHSILPGRSASGGPTLADIQSKRQTLAEQKQTLELLRKMLRIRIQQEEARH